MEGSLFTEDASEDVPFEFDKFTEDYTAVDGERCGICMDIVIDRGVLDCCEHWFCFTCIDNWSTITNLCPLCQTEFQLITCLPVYDTIGSNKVDEDSFYRDEEDWFIEGKSNTLSFPSYYIDENAVTCLDGDDCRMRSESVSIQEDPNLDTSIACDSCDTWYHAFCVGFVPDATCETSWLCPRCLVKENLNESDADPRELPRSQNVISNKINDGVHEASFSAKVSVSVADAGETAMIVSMVQDNPMTEGPSGAILIKNTDKDQTLVRMTTLVANIPDDIPSTGKASCHTDLEAEGSDLSFPADASSGPDMLGHFPERRSKESFSNNEQNKYGMDLHNVLSEGCALSGVDIIKNEVAQSEVTMDIHAESTSDHCLLPATKMVLDSKNNVDGVKVGKRKCREPSDDVDSAPESETKAKSGASAKKIRARAKVQVLNVPDEQRKCPSPTAVSHDKIFNLEQNSNASDIMSIVRSTHGTSRSQAAKSIRNIENTTGLRVKKILRTSVTAEGDKESFMLVQNLRKEIREAVRNKPSNDLGENRFDPKLLAAFRAALIGSVTEPAKPNLAVKAKKLMLQKGSVRENLTKKIYGISGRRKRSWTRDCEIEFWKHRCSKVSKPEKVETLKSVLDHLKKSSEETGNGTEFVDGNPILSRLYLADTSVFPRKDDIKPLSAIKTTTVSEQSKEPTSSEDAFAGSTRTVKNTQLNKQPETGSSNKLRTTCSKNAITGKKISSSIDDGPKDKKKWALEILARKNAMSIKCVVGAEKQKDENDIPKGNYPLLAQLPTEMKPVLATILHKKIPVTVRQVQLYRLTEHFLRKANLPVICRTAETEFAVADAVNIEKGIADRCNSKVVYLNLMSQEILHGSKPSGATETNSSFIITSDISEAATGAPEIEQALISAGFLSDSPPPSPYHHQVEENKGGPANNPLAARIEEEEECKGDPDNILEMDSYPELNIYGDFEYDLEDNDLIGGSSSTVVAKPQPDESKMKVVFSSFPTKVPGPSPLEEDNERIGKMNTTKNSSCSKGSSLLNLDMNMEKNCPTDPMEISTDLATEEPSPAECEELYGPEKEELGEKFPLIKANVMDANADKAETLDVQSVDLLQAATTTPECSNQQTTCTNETIPEKKELSTKANAMDSNTDKTERSVDLQQAATTTPDCSNQQTTSTNETIPAKKELSTKANAMDVNADKAETLVVQSVNLLQAATPTPECSNQKTNSTNETIPAKKELSTKDAIKHPPDCFNPVAKKVEAYIKEHIRPLCKSGVITVHQYRIAVRKTTDKVMSYHSKDKNANFLIKEGDKVKKLAEQYIEAAKQAEEQK